MFSNTTNRHKSGLAIVLIELWWFYLSTTPPWSGWKWLFTLCWFTKFGQDNNGPNTLVGARPVLGKKNPNHKPLIFAPQVQKASSEMYSLLPPRLWLRPPSRKTEVVHRWRRGNYAGDYWLSNGPFTNTIRSIGAEIWRRPWITPNQRQNVTH